MSSDKSGGSHVQEEDEPLLEGGEKSRKQLASQNQLLKFLVVFFAVGLLVSLVWIAIYRTLLIPKPQEICQTPSCVKLAGQMVAAMNTSVDPCDNFYEYACGGWVASHTLPSYLGRLVTFTILDELNKKRLEGQMGEPGTGTEANSTAIAMAKDLYKTCLDTKQIDEIGAAPVMDLIAEIHGGSAFNVQDAYTTIALQSSSTPFFGFDVQPDQKNTTRNLVTFSQGGLGMDSASYYSLPDSDPQVIAYKTFTRSALKLLDFADAETLADAVYGIEKAIATFTKPPADLRDPYAIYNLMSLDELTKAAPAFDFVKLSKALVGAKAAEGVSGTMQVIVQVPSYMSNVSSLMSSTSKATEAYMVWITVMPLLQYLSSPFRTLVADYQKVSQGTSPPVRAQTCIGIADATLGYATGRVFVDNYFSEDSKTEVSAMIQGIKSEFKANVDTLKWMDSNTKQLAKDKVDAVLPIIAYPELIVNNTLLDAEYTDYEFNFTCFACSMLMSARVVRTEELQSVFKPVPRGNWEMTADTVNAYYDPDFNNIVFPAGILQAPFYEGDFIKVVKFGGIGAVMGHELTHGFDDQGSQFDKAGNLHKWWPNSVYKSFAAKTQCIARQYENYTLDGTHVNGNLTLGENIADHGGLKMSFHAYKTWKQSNPGDTRLPGLAAISEEQLFFLAYAQLWCSKGTKQDAQQRLKIDPHSPPRFRVIGTLSSSEEFVDTWKCKAGSPMNRADKCIVW